MNALDIKSLKKTYTNGTNALKGINLSVPQGDFFGLLGPNGAGKSTIIGIISSLIRKTSGKVQIFNTDIDENFPLAKSFIGITPQEINFNQFETVEDIILNQAGFYGMPKPLAKNRLEELLQKLRLEEKRNEISRNLSGGMKRRLMIARALIHKPKLLLLDEPTAGVDIEIRHSIWSFLEELNRLGTTIILTTHNLEEVEILCRNIGIINSGNIIEDTSLRGLLSQLDSESYILDLENEVTDSQIADFPEMKAIDKHQIEININKKNKSLNTLFLKLSDKGIAIRSMRNKNNRLEKLFLDLVSTS